MNFVEHKYSVHITCIFLHKILQSLLALSNTTRQLITILDSKITNKNMKN